jgi:hypothetical protein
LTLAPSAAAAAIIGMLAFGALVGSAVSPASPSGANTPLRLAVSPSTQATPPVSVLAPLAEAPPPAPEPVAPVPVAGSAPAAASQHPAAPSSGAPVAPPNPFGPPPIRHVFLIMLSDQNYAAAFSPASPARYLAKTLTREGELLPNYYAVAPGELANGIALMSGQGPTPQTVADCPQYVDLTPGTIGPGGQIVGSGCVYPAETLTLANQLEAKGLSWAAYVEDMGSAASGKARTCLHPPLGAADPDQAPRPGDAQVTSRNPFVYFHALTDTPSCAQNDVGLDRLARDLRRGARAPSFAYIVPDRCHDGSDQPCGPGQPAGLVAADLFLRKVVPEIERSPAYADHGLIAITFDEAPQSGPGADPSSCCETPTYPNLTRSSSDSPSSDASAPTSTVPTTATTTPASTATASAPTSTPAATAGPVSPSGGGGQVGLLLISSYVQRGTVNSTDYFNHFSLLRSIEDIFGLEHLGYATAAALPTFDASVFDAKPAQGGAVRTRATGELPPRRMRRGVQLP